MNLKELHAFKMSDAVELHDELNPVLFQEDKLKPEVRERLIEIAQDFIEHLGIDNFDIEDITLSGSSAAYSYTPHSDIDIHLITNISDYKDDDVYRELFDAKKNVFNETHDIKIGPYDVELYVQDTAQPHVSLGDYSILNDKWNKHPIKRRANYDTTATKLKFEKLAQIAQAALKSRDLERVENVISTIKKYRKAGLDEHGEFGPENLSFKALRTQGVIQQLYDLKNKLHSDTFSLNEGLTFLKPGQLRGSYSDAQLKELGFKIVNGSWAIDSNKYQQLVNSGKLNESASGYIPSNAERNDPRFKTALTVDIKPDSLQKNARKLGFKISRAGIPPLLRP